MTQIGEMSINISSHLIADGLLPVGTGWHSGVGPLSSVFAEFRRHHRSDRRRSRSGGRRDGNTYAWPYVEIDPDTRQGERKVYRPVAAYANTLQEVENLSEEAAYRLTPENLVEHTNRLYQQATAFSAAAETNWVAYRELIENNWLLTGDTGNNEEDTKMGFWKSRDITDQVTVLIRQSPTTVS